MGLIITVVIIANPNPKKTFDSFVYYEKKPGKKHATGSYAQTNIRSVYTRV